MITIIGLLFCFCTINAAPLLDGFFASKAVFPIQYANALKVKPPVVSHYGQGETFDESLHSTHIAAKITSSPNALASIPASIRSVLPANISVDLFFLVFGLPMTELAKQTSMLWTAANIRFHFWVFSWKENYQNGFQINMPMGIFEADNLFKPENNSNTIMSPMPFDTLQPREVFYHNAISPNNSQFSIDAWKPCASFWLCGLSPDRKRACVAFILQLNKPKFINSLFEKLFARPFTPALSDQEKITQLITGMNSFINEYAGPSELLSLNKAVKFLESIVPINSHNITEKLTELDKTLISLKLII